MRRHGERQPHVHPARVALHRRVEEPLDLGERDDLVELARDLGAAHAEDRAVQEDVLAAGQLRVEPGPDLQQASRRARRIVRVPVGRLGDAREDLQQRALAGAVAADDADDLALPGPRSETSCSAQNVARRRASASRARKRAGTARAAIVASAIVAQRPVASRRVAELVPLAEAVDADRERRSSLSTDVREGLSPCGGSRTAPPTSSDEHDRAAETRDERPRERSPSRAAPSGIPRPRRPSGSVPYSSRHVSGTRLLG